MVFIDGFKVGKVTGIINKDVLAQFYIEWHDKLKRCLPRKIMKFINLCILKKEGG